MYPLVSWYKHLLTYWYAFIGLWHIKLQANAKEGSCRVAGNNLNIKRDNREYKRGKRRDKSSTGLHVNVIVIEKLLT